VRTPTHAFADPELRRARRPDQRVASVPATVGRPAAGLLDDRLRIGPCTSAPRAEDTGEPVDSGVAAAIRRAGPGRALPTVVRAQLEEATGADLGRVRLHTDPRAGMLARSVGARAFTVGADVFLRDGEPAVETPAGQGILAHEVDHVLHGAPGELHRLTDEDVTSSADKKKLKKIREKYFEYFGQLGGTLRQYEKESWDYWFAKADTLKDLEDGIDRRIKQAEEAEAKKKAASTSVPTATPEPETTSKPTVSQPVPTPKAKAGLGTGTTTAPTTKKKKTPKPKAMTLGEFGSTAPKASGVALEPVSETDTTNTFIAAAILHTGEAAGVTVQSVYVDGGPSDDTVYYGVVLYGPVQQPTTGRLTQWRKVWTLYLHYHPAPTTGNWLHLKRAHGGTPGNQVAKNNWMFANWGAILRQGKEAWEQRTGLTVAGTYALP
jgi:hypothetical protein